MRSASITHSDFQRTYECSTKPSIWLYDATVQIQSRGGKKGSKVFGSVHDPRAAEDIFRLVLEKKKYIVSPVVHLSSICIFLHV